MNRRAQGISLVSKLLLTLVVILIIAGIIYMTAERFGDDVEGLGACESRAAQSGGRGFCASDSGCTQPVVGQEATAKFDAATEYKQYLGFDCLDEDGEPLAPRQYCCAIYPTSVNPPTRTEAAGTLTGNAIGG